MFILNFGVFLCDFGSSGSQAGPSPVRPDCPVVRGRTIRPFLRIKAGKFCGLGETDAYDDHDILKDEDISIF